MADNQKQDTSAWPSDCCEKEKFNIVEFYHKILWASQQEQERYQHYEDHHNKTRKRVTFSAEPPQIYEYEPEYTTSTLTTSFLSGYIKRKLRPVQNEQFPTKRPQPKSPVPPLLLEDYFKDKTIVRVRSITDFNPVPNQFYKQQQQQEAPAYHESMHTFDPTFMHIDMSFDIEHQEDMYALSTCAPADLEDSITTLSSPPPSYSDQECMIKRKKSLAGGLRKRISMNFWSSHSGESASSTSTDSNTVAAEKKGIIRTLRKIKSSPRLMIQRRASVASLRKKASFLVA
ncbi:hypothetical protein V8B55DRAFT_1367889 [Mucor lusitanicus]|uniref:Uncharacterized protein n=2 Tax=Mucor circinelloides f. lusitanicus TaxID=29924 RepID=A0A162QWT9_MUCCL|nr:hypothetical protein FB192DRAFT_1460355 [Mucor lusitanicus]OAD06340.1 hypothetical protein MUCCIDRAFT_78607 [Mucor lusitanicus CBS 277.49]